MATTIGLQIRLTHRYVGTHQLLDDWRHVGTARALPARLVREPRPEDAYHDEGTYLMRVRAPRGQDPELTERALRDMLTSEGCSHEYDCCGCVSQRARVRRLTPRDFAVFISVSRNY